MFATVIFKKFDYSIIVIIIANFNSIIMFLIIVIDVFIVTINVDF